MDLTQLDRGLRVAGVSTAVLLVSLFLPWYGITASYGGELGDAHSSVSALHALRYTDLLLLVIVFLSAAAIALAASGTRPELPFSLEQGLVGLGLLAALLVFLRIVNVPFPDDAAGTITVSRKLGGWLALIAAVGVATGGRQAHVLAASAQSRTTEVPAG